MRAGAGKIQEESRSIHKAVETLKEVSADVNESVLDVQKACTDIAASLAVAQKIAEGKYLSMPA